MIHHRYESYITHPCEYGDIPVFEWYAEAYSIEIVHEESGKYPVDLNFREFEKNEFEVPGMDMRGSRG